MWQRASITGYNELNEHPNGEDLLPWIKLKSQTQLLNIKESPRFKPQKIKKQPLRRKVDCIYAHLLSILSSEANKAGRLGRIECCVLIGSVQSGTETVSSKQRQPIREPFWNGAGQLQLLWTGSRDFALPS